MFRCFVTRGSFRKPEFSEMERQEQKGTLCILLTVSYFTAFLKHLKHDLVRRGWWIFILNEGSFQIFLNAFKQMLLGIPQGRCQVLWGLGSFCRTRGSNECPTIPTLSPGGHLWRPSLTFPFSIWQLCCGNGHSDLSWVCWCMSTSSSDLWYGGETPHLEWGSLSQAPGLCTLPSHLTTSIHLFHVHESEEISVFFPGLSVENWMNAKALCGKHQKQSVQCQISLAFLTLISAQMPSVQGGLHWPHHKYDHSSPSLPPFSAFL